MTTPDPVGERSGDAFVETFALADVAKHVRFTNRCPQGVCADCLYDALRYHHLKVIPEEAL